MPRGDEFEEDDDEMEEGEEDEYADEEDDDGGKAKTKRSRNDFIDDYADEDDGEEEDDDDEDYGGGGRRGKRQRSASQFFDEEAAVDSDGEEDEEEGEDDFIDTGADLPDEDGRRMRRPLLPREDEQDDVDEMARRIQERYARSRVEYDEEESNVEQQALLPSVRDPKLWLVKCAVGREREVAVCLMQKYIDKGSELHIRSTIALDHLKGFIYIEADKEAHVREAIKGMHNIFPGKIILVPIKEMTAVLSVESKTIDIATGTWVRMKIGTYKGDLAEVIDVDNVKQRATVKLIPRVDLQALSNKLEGREVPKKKPFTPHARLLNLDEARELNIRIERGWDQATSGYYDKIEGMMFKDGFLYKKLSLKSLSTQNIQPTFDELEKFRHPSGSGSGDISDLSAVVASRKKGHFMKGDRVIVVNGELQNLKGRVEKVEEDTVHMKIQENGLPETLTITGRELCKYFEPGNHVKVVSGAKEGATGMVVSVQGHLVNIVSDTTKEILRVFADYVVVSSEVTSGVTRIGEFELHDLVLLEDNNFGVIIRVESDAFQVLMGIPDRPHVSVLSLRDVKCKIDKKNNTHDHYKNTLSVKDAVKILAGPFKGEQGSVEHIYKGILFVHDRHHVEHAGFICVKADSCMMVGGLRRNLDRNGKAMISRFANLRTLPHIPPSPTRSPRVGAMNFGGRNGGRFGGGRGHDALQGAVVKIRLGHYKGHKGRVVDIKGSTVRVELESQMKIVAVDRGHISDNVNVSTPFRETSRYGMGSETPMHPYRTPMHPSVTPMRDPAATPHHDGMRTPMRDRAWNPYAPMTPHRDDWEDGNPGSWGSSPQYQPRSPTSRAYEAPTPGSGWSNTSGGNYDAGTPRDNSPAYANAPSPYVPSNSGGQPPMTPSSAYLPSTPGGQPMTPGSGGLDMMSPVIGTENEGLWFLPDILVNVHRGGEDFAIGVIREVLPDGSCKVALGSSGIGEMVNALASDIEILNPRKTDRIKIMGGAHRGATGKLIGIDGTDGIVKIDDTLDVKILDMGILAKFVKLDKEKS